MVFAAATSITKFFASLTKLSIVVEDKYSGQCFGLTESAFKCRCYVAFVGLGARCLLTNQRRKRKQRKRGEGREEHTIGIERVLGSSSVLRQKETKQMNI